MRTHRLMPALAKVMAAVPSSIGATSAAEAASCRLTSSARGTWSWSQYTSSGSGGRTALRRRPWKVAEATSAMQRCAAASSLKVTNAKPVHAAFRPSSAYDARRR